MTLFVNKPFTSHAGQDLLWKIECDALEFDDLETLAAIIARHIPFSDVIGIPTGGLRLAKSLQKYSGEGGTLIVDDVYTTGMSMEAARKDTDGVVRGAVIFARKPPPKWIKAIFTLGIGE